ncbi:uncharacterized protein DNG_03036 [Cephalotrichum gorgonifer]|uniref:Uncharacterized protein n=1 Tax=Cephalotrichum gorgonifer TaxID=2041049 RepID=A0AAE8MTI0_9PEZI|nr:uncharacterized protein DNG_03036 [Cephalotrichum gorgonifer]
MYKPIHRVKPHAWRRMVLTTSQVSILLTSVIILVFTAALFVSGCAIQKRTLVEIRTAIKNPTPSPKIYLPDRFRHTTTELADGTVIIIDDDYHADRRREQKKIEAAAEARHAPSSPHDGPAAEEDTPERRALLREAETKEGFVGPARRPAAEERVLSLRERNERAMTEQNLKHPDPRAVDQRPVSRAERRRLIKEELKRLSEVEGPAYQRRLW